MKNFLKTHLPWILVALFASFSIAYIGVSAGNSLQNQLQQEKTILLNNMEKLSMKNDILRSEITSNQITWNGYNTQVSGIDIYLSTLSSKKAP